MHETERPRYRVHREAVLSRVPANVRRTSTGLARYFGLSRSVAWRLFLGPDGHLAGGHSAARICATFPDAKSSELFIEVEPAGASS